MSQTACKTPIADLIRSVVDNLNDGWRMSLDRPDGLATQNVGSECSLAIADALSALTQGGVKGEERGLIKFAKEMIDCAWQGGDADGGFIQDFAEKCGLLQRVKFDPNKHMDHYGDAQEGQDWFVYAGPLERSPALSTTLQEPEVERDALVGKLWAMHDIAQISENGFTYLNDAARVVIADAAATISRLTAEAKSYAALCAENDTLRDDIATYRRLKETAEASNKLLSECIAVLESALDTAKTALEDWLHTYAPDECNEEKVKESSRRIFQAGGTLAYLADVFAAIRRARSASPIVQEGERHPVDSGEKQ